MRPQVDKIATARLVKRYGKGWWISKEVYHCGYCPSGFMHSPDCPQPKNTLTDAKRLTWLLDTLNMYQFAPPSMLRAKILSLTKNTKVNRVTLDAAIKASKRRKP